MLEQTTVILAPTLFIEKASNYGVYSFDERPNISGRSTGIALVSKLLIINRRPNFFLLH